MAAKYTHFDPEHPPPGLEGLDDAFIADLHDFVANYGAEVRKVEGLRRMIVVAEVPVLLTAAVPPSRMKSISVRPTSDDGGGSASYLMILDDEVHSYIMWDRRVTVAQVREAIAAIDAEMAESRHPLTGRRQRVQCDQYAPPTLEVDRVFGEKGSVLPLLEGADPEAVRYQFDRPDDLEIVPDVGKKGRFGLRRKRAALSDADVDEITAKVLEKYGVKSQTDIDRMSGDTLRRMLAELKAEIERGK